MSIAGIVSSTFSNNQVGSQYQLTSSQFQQLGQDLASGNLSAAQSDFASLQQSFAQTAVASPSNSNPVAQAFQQLATDLKSGNLTAAQKDYSTIQQDAESARHLHNHHRMRIENGPEQNVLLQDLNQLGQTTAGGASAASPLGAQQAYATLQQDAQQVALGGESELLGSTVASSAVSFLA